MIKFKNKDETVLWTSAVLVALGNIKLDYSRNERVVSPGTDLGHIASAAADTVIKDLRERINDDES